MLRISARVEGASVAPAVPSRARVAISISELVENAASTEAAPKAAAPISSSRLRPIWSPSVPIVIRNPATLTRAGKRGGVRREQRTRQPLRPDPASGVPPVGRPRVGARLGRAYRSTVLLDELGPPAGQHKGRRASL